MNETILLVDDNRMFIEIQKEFLQSARIEILTAYDGQETLGIIKNKKPDLIFMDYQMPKMDGAACCRAIKSDPELACIPVVMVTSKGNEEDIQACFSAGCDFFMTKPLDRDTFLGIARKYIPDVDRREKRFPVKWDAVLRIKDVNLACTLHDVSAGGAFVVIDYFAIPNSVINISITIPDGTIIDCAGRIAWVNRIYSKFPKGVGIKFALMPKLMQTALVNYLDTIR
jgi:CheY-like chemotaxis protein